MYELMELLEDHQMYHMDIQIDCAITGGRDLYGQYKQALRELYKRTRGLRQLYTDRDLLKIDIEEAQAELDSGIENQYEARRAELKQRQRIGQLEEADRAVEDTEREFRRFYAQCSVLKDKIEETHGSLEDPNIRRKLENETWLYHLKLRAATDFAAGRRVSDYVINNMVGLPVEMRRDLAKNFKNPQGLVNWMENEAECTLSHQIDTEKMNKLLEVPIPKLLEGDK